MSRIEYEYGTIKVVWIDRNTRKIHSRMFAEEKDAEAFGSPKGDYIIFRLLTQEGMETFTWELLPYGKYRWYRVVVGTYKTLKRLLVWSPTREKEKEIPQA